MESATKVWTEEEIWALPHDAYRYEVIGGELVMSPKNNFQHEGFVERLLVELSQFNRAHHLGAVRGSSLGCWMANRNLRAPDISFITKSRLRALGPKFDPRKFLPCAPDLVVEIVSASNTRGEISARLKDFFSSGCQIAWIVYPEEQFVEVCHSLTDRKIIGAGGELDGEHLLPGFRYSTTALFAEENWE